MRDEMVDKAFSFDSFNLIAPQGVSHFHPSALIPHPFTERLHP
jgi:hypothetical protein